MTMDQRQALLLPIFENQQPALPIAPALTVHVEIQFSDPVIRSRYYRSYGTSPEFIPTARICRGLLRRIERCSQELITRKDSTALDALKEDTYECKSLRYEITFRIVTKDHGEWAERTYRSYQKQPLTVDLTKDIILASHRMVGLFLRRHDDGFQWLDGAVRDTSLESPQTTLPPHDARLTLLCVPGSRFIESTQSFEFVPGYTIEVSFQSRHPFRIVPVYARSIRINSEQTAPLSLFMIEDLLWNGLQAINQSLEQKKREFDSHVGECIQRECHHSLNDESLNIELRVANNLGAVYSHLCRSVQSKFALFRDPGVRDCDGFLDGIEATLNEVRSGVDAKLNELHDFDFRIVELRGTGWSVKQLASFNIDSSTSYGRRTIQAALDRIQTGIADVLRGHDVAIHISAYKRGHLVLDKAIVAHVKRGMPLESFATLEDEREAFVSRLKTRIQRDIDTVFEDTCSIDDIPDEEFYTPLSIAAEVEISSPKNHAGWTQEGQPLGREPSAPTTPIKGSPKPPIRRAFSLKGRSPRTSQDSVMPIESISESMPTIPVKESPKSRVQRMFSLTSSSPGRSPARSPRTDVDSVRSVGSINDLQSDYSTNATSVTSDDISERFSVLSDDGPPTVIISLVKSPQRIFPLLTKKYAARVNNALTLIEEFPSGPGGADSVHERSVEETENVERVTLKTNEDTKKASNPLADDALTLMTLGKAKSDHVTLGARIDPAPGHPISLVERPGSIDEPQQSIESILRRKMDSPEFFEDAAEFAPDPGLGEIKLETSNPHFGRASPSIDVYSTAPSTPSLSTGADSTPRNSILITPTYLRRQSGLKDFGELDFQGPTMCEAEIDVTPAPKIAETDTNQSREILQPTGSCPGPDIMQNSTVLVGGPDGGSDARVDSAKGGPTAATNKFGAELSQSVYLGAERVVGLLDDRDMQTDFPTNPVQASCPNLDDALTPKQVPDPHGDRAREPTSDVYFGPASLWGNLADPETTGSVTDEPLGPTTIPDTPKNSVVNAVAEAEHTEEALAPESTSDAPGVFAKPVTVTSDEALSPTDLWGILGNALRAGAEPEASADKVLEFANNLDTPASSLVCVETELGFVEETPALEDICDTLAGSAAYGEVISELAVDGSQPANLWGILVAPEVLGDKVLGPAELWGILSSSGVQGPQQTDEVQSEIEASTGNAATDAAGGFKVMQPSNVDGQQENPIGSEILADALAQEIDAAKPSRNSGDQDTADPLGLSDDLRDAQPVGDKSSEVFAEPAVEQQATSSAPEASLEIVSDGQPVIDDADVSSLVENEVEAKIHTQQVVVPKILPQPKADTICPGNSDSGQETVPVPVTFSVAAVQSTVAGAGIMAESETKEPGAEVSDLDVEALAEVVKESFQVKGGGKVNDTEPMGKSDGVNETVGDVSGTAKLDGQPTEVEVAAAEIVLENVSGPANTTQPNPRDLNDRSAREIDGEVTECLKHDEPNVENEARSVDLNADVLENAMEVFGPEIEPVTSTLGSDKTTVTPEISVRDFAAPATATKEAPTEVPLTKHSSETPEARPAKIDKSSPVASSPIFSRQYLTPSPVVSPRRSTSSFQSSWSEYTLTSRGSVETVRPSEPERSSPERCQSRPQTAGYLGLAEKRGLGIGLRGALGGSRRRISLPADQAGAEAVNTYIKSIDTPTSSTERRAKRRKLGQSREDETQEMEKTEKAEAYQAPVLPRVMMLLAGVVAIGKVLKGSSR